jgi:hypothetical protein
MKKIQLFIIAIFFITTGFSQKFEIGLNAIAGLTIVDVEKAMEKVLTDWDQFSYGFNIYGLYHLNNGIAAGFETGFNQLYYWEEYYGYGGYYRWGDISTILFGPLVELKMNRIYAQSGLNLRIFTNGSGTVPAFMFGCGYIITVSGRLYLPVGLRTDIVFGSATPVPVNLTLGLRYAID